MPPPRGKEAGGMSPGFLRKMRGEAFNYGIFDIIVIEFKIFLLKSDLQLMSGWQTSSAVAHVGRLESQILGPHSGPRTPSRAGRPGEDCSLGAWLGWALPTPRAMV